MREYKEYKWINEFTGEVFQTLPEAISTMFLDMIRCDKCRTPEMFQIKRLKEN